MTVQLSPAASGCWVDGHWGQYGAARVIEIAQEFGYADHDALELARRHMASMGPSTDPGLDSDEYDTLCGYAEDAEEWLSENVAPEGHSFGWCEGEFFLWPAAQWESEG
jgi:hypothetical protein